MSKYLVIYNPMAGAKKFINTRSIIENTLKKEKHSYDFFETIKTKRQPLNKFLKNKYDKIIVAGGDGTVAEVTSFLIKNKIKSPLIIIPQGSANILAISLKLPKGIRPALLKGLNNKGKPLDAMLINRKYYGIIATGCGYDTLVIQRTSRSLKRKMGIIAYLWVILKTIFVYSGKPYRITIDGKRRSVVAKTIMIFNILPMGHLKISKPFIGNPILGNDGKLNIFILNPRPIRDFFRHKKAVKIYTGEKISIKTKKSRKFQIDGNIFKGNSINIEVLSKAIKIVY